MYETKNDVVRFFTSHAEFSEKNYITLMILNKLMLCYGLILFPFANSCVNYSDLHKVTYFVKKAKFAIFHVEYFCIRL